MPLLSPDEVDKAIGVYFCAAFGSAVNESSGRYELTELVAGHLAALVAWSLSLPTTPTEDDLDAEFDGLWASLKCDLKENEERLALMSHRKGQKNG